MSKNKEQAKYVGYFNEIKNFLANSLEETSSKSQICSISNKIKEILTQEYNKYLCAKTIHGGKGSATCLSIVGTKSHYNEKMLIHFLAENKTLEENEATLILEYFIKYAYDDNGLEMGKTLVNYPSLEYVKNSTGKYVPLFPIHYAIRSNKIKNVMLFLEFGADCELAGGIEELKEFAAKDKNVSKEMKNYINSVDFNKRISQSNTVQEYQSDQYILDNLEILRKEKLQSLITADKIKENKNRLISSLGASIKEDKWKEIQKESKAFEIKEESFTQGSSTKSKSYKKINSSKTKISELSNRQKSTLGAITGFFKPNIKPEVAAIPVITKPLSLGQQESVLEENSSFFINQTISPVSDTLISLPIVECSAKTVPTRSDKADGILSDNQEIQALKRTAMNADISQKTIHPKDVNDLEEVKALKTKNGSNVNSPEKKKTKKSQRDLAAIPFSLVGDDVSSMLIPDNLKRENNSPVSSIAGLSPFYSALSSASTSPVLTGVSTASTVPVSPANLSPRFSAQNFIDLSQEDDKENRLIYAPEVKARTESSFFARKYTKEKRVDKSGMSPVSSNPDSASSSPVLASSFSAAPVSPANLSPRLGAKNFVDLTQENKLRYYPMFRKNEKYGFISLLEKYKSGSKDSTCSR